MKFSLPLLAGVAALALPGAHAQDVSDPPRAPAAAQRQVRSDEQLDQLLGPIALYPDALIALILPASTNITDLVLAARFLRMTSDAAQIESQGWDDSVKALAHYPEVVKWMDDNLEWTKQLGEAFGAQPSDVMRATQRLRERARMVGSLSDNAQQRVVDSGGAIAIEPAQPDVIYVPHYDSEVVYSDNNYDYGTPYITYGVGLPVGVWLDYDCDWRGRSIWVGRRDNNHWHPVYAGRPTRVVEAHVWHPNSQYYHSSPTNRWAVRTEIVHPRPVTNSTNTSHLYPNRPANPNGWSHDHREGLLRESDGREIRRPASAVTPAASPAVTTPPTPAAAVPRGTVRVEGFRNDHHRENRPPSDSPAATAPNNSNGRFLPATRPVSPGTVPVQPRGEYRAPRASVPVTPAASAVSPPPRPQPAPTPPPQATPRTSDAPHRGGDDPGHGRNGR